jgi:hypothetical protein
MCNRGLSCDVSMGKRAQVDKAVLSDEGNDDDDDGVI